MNNPVSQSIHRRLNPQQKYRHTSRRCVKTNPDPLKSNVADRTPGAIFAVTAVCQYFSMPGLTFCDRPSPAPKRNAGSGCLPWTHPDRLHRSATSIEGVDSGLSGMPVQPCLFPGCMPGLPCRPLFRGGPKLCCCDRGKPPAATLLPGTLTPGAFRIARRSALCSLLCSSAATTNLDD
jgi:hypothetical protein